MKLKFYTNKSILLSLVFVLTFIKSHGELWCGIEDIDYESGVEMGVLTITTFENGVNYEVIVPCYEFVDTGEIEGRTIRRLVDCIKSNDRYVSRYIKETKDNEIIIKSARPYNIMKLHPDGVIINGTSNYTFLVGIDKEQLKMIGLQPTGENMKIRIHYNRSTAPIAFHNNGFYCNLKIQEPGKLSLNYFYYNYLRLDADKNDKIAQNFEWLERYFDDMEYPTGLKYKLAPVVIPEQLLKDDD